MFEGFPLLRHDRPSLLFAGVLACFFLLVCLAGTGRTDVHRVELKKHVMQDAELTFDAEEQEKALSRAVLKEAEQILAGTLPRGRKKVIQKFLRRKVDDFVLSYSEQQYMEEKNTGVLSLEVNVNTQSVKDELKKWGTYFTAAREWDYRLDVRGTLDREEELSLADLESMSGLRRDRKAPGPVFVLLPPREEGDHWEALLRRNGEETLYMAQSLDKLWLKTWSDFFSLREVRLRVERMMRLSASGWSTSTGIRHFDSLLGEWSTELDRAVIQSIHFEPEGLGGTWTVYTLTPAELRSRLKSYISSRSLDFRLEEVNATKSLSD
ncbi:MAG: hypothetical protein K9J48_04295 [Desulfohalobiaceae bacterium]|nr:hypothetical protein [Desulfohalobiaceae bacterium]